MKYERKVIKSDPEVLYNGHYIAVPVVIDTTAGTVPAGTVVDKTGKAANTGEAFGVLQWSVDSDNPNGSVVIHGFINEKRLPASVSDEAKAVLKQITFIN